MPRDNSFSRQYELINIRIKGGQSAFQIQLSAKRLRNSASCIVEISFSLEEEEAADTLTNFAEGTAVRFCPG